MQTFALLAQPPIPPNHGQLGGLNENINVDPNLSGPMWTYEKNTDCEIIFTTFFTIKYFDETLNEWVEYEFALDPYNPVSWLPFYTSYEAVIAKVYADKQWSNSFTITHMTVQLQINGTNYYIFPGDSKTMYTGQPYPCDCIVISFNEATRKVIINACPQ